LGTRLKYLQKIRRYFLIVLLLCGLQTANAQNSSLEFWPETNVWYRLNPSWRLASFVAITKYYESKNRDLNTSFMVDYAWGHTKNRFVGRLQDEAKSQILKAWLIRGGYMNGFSLYDFGESYQEDLAFSELHKRIPLRGEVLLSLRIRTDFRWIGENADWSYRLRYRVMVEKEFKVGKSSYVPYVSAEPFWDSRYSLFNRIRAITGATLVWGKSLGTEVNFTYQFDSKATTENVYAINLILHVYLERMAKK